MGDDKEAKIPSKPMASIPAGMEKLEEGIRKLYDRLDSVMAENLKAENVDKAAPLAHSPMSESLVLMNELIDDINSRLEL